MTKDIRLKLFKIMYKIRLFEYAALDLYQRNLIKGSVHLYIGQEAIAAGACLNLRDEDCITSTHRGHGHCIAKGGNVNFMMAELLGKRTGLCKGKGGSMHIADPDIGIYGANGIVGGGMGIAAGLAFSSKYFNNGRVILCFFGEGAFNQGILYELMNICSLWKLPVIFLCENNGYALSTPYKECVDNINMVDKVKSFGIDAETIDGNDVEKVYKTAKKYIKNARENKVPGFIEAVTYRWFGHFVGDKEVYRSKNEVKEWKNKCPIKTYHNFLIELGYDKKEIEDIKKKVDEEIKIAQKFALNSPEPERESIFEDIFC
jgi:TPP-dependent pyruvate/acetoin dehydrogenase alpha subunit